jgi:hypothetical protein
MGRESSQKPVKQQLTKNGDLKGQKKAASAGAGAAWVKQAIGSVHEDRDQDNDRDRHTQEPQQ